LVIPALLIGWELRLFRIGWLVVGLAIGGFIGLTPITIIISLIIRLRSKCFDLIIENWG